MGPVETRGAREGGELAREKISIIQNSMKPQAGLK